MYKRFATTQLAVLAGVIYKTDSPSRSTCMNIQLYLAPLVSLIAGILILIMPRLLNFIVAIYLIIIGAIGLFGGHIPH